MAVRVKLPRVPPARKAAVIEPFSRAVRRAFHEIMRCREIEWRYIERAEWRHDAHIDLVRTPSRSRMSCQAINRVIECKCLASDPLGNSFKEHA